MLSRVQNLQNKLRTFEAKVKQVEDIATEDEFFCWSGNDFNEVKPMLTDLNVHDESGAKSGCSVKAPDQNVALMDEPKLNCNHLCHKGDVLSSVNQTRKGHLRGRVYWVAQEHLHNGRRRHIVGVIGKLLRIHPSHPQRAKSHFPQAVFKDNLEVSEHCTMLSEYTPDKRFSVNIDVNHLPLIDRNSFAFVAFFRQLGVHSPKGSSVLFPFFVSRSQILGFEKDLLADFHFSITNRNLSAAARFCVAHVGADSIRPKKSGQVLPAPIKR